MQNIMIICKNIFKITFRKKSNIFTLIFLPIILMVAMVGLFSTTASKTSIGFLNNSPSKITEDLYNNLKNSDSFEVQEVTNENYLNLIQKRKIAMVIKIDSDFTEKVKNGENPKLELITAQGKESSAWINAFLDNYLWNLNSIAKASNGNDEVFNKIYENYKDSNLKFEIAKIKDTTRDKEATKNSMGLLLYLLLIGGGSTTTIMLREREEETYFRIKASPVSTRIYLAGNFLAGILIVIVRVLILILAMRYLVKVDTFVADSQLFLILTIFGIVGVALGTLITSLSKNLTQASLLMTFIAVPSCMLSGSFWDIKFMPDFMQKIANFLPQTWTMRSIEYLQQGKSFMEVAPYILLVFMFALVFIVIGIYLLKNREDNWKAV